MPATVRRGHTRLLHARPHHPPHRTIAVVGNSHAWRLVLALTLYGEQHARIDNAPGMRPTSDPECIARFVGDDPCSVDRKSVLPPNPIVDLTIANPRLAAHVSLTQYFCDVTRCHGLIGGWWCTSTQTI